MTSTGVGFLPLDRQLFHRSLGEAMAELVRQRWPRDTAKHVSKRFDLDPVTAANLAKGHCSERSFSKALAAEGWALGFPLLEAMIGHSYHDHLLSLIEEHAKAQQRRIEHAAEVTSLRARAARLGLVEVRGSSGADRNGAGQGRRPDDAPGASAHRRR